MTVRPRVFVTGGSGAIGSHAVPELVRAGCDAVALVRTPAKAAQIAAHGATPALVSLFDRTHWRSPSPGATPSSTWRRRSRAPHGS
jgi:uncharacterized protein YbjT (DUF2867 family)